MAISTVSSNSGAPVNSATGAASGNSLSNPAQLNESQFLQLLTAQLQNQDPTNPISNTDFTSQLAQFSSLAGIQQLNQNFQQLLQIQQLSQGADLVGKVVTFGPTAANAAQGTVGAASVQNGQLTFQIDGQNVPSDQVYSVLSSSGS